LNSSSQFNQNLFNIKGGIGSASNIIEKLTLNVRALEAQVASLQTQLSMATTARGLYLFYFSLPSFFFFKKIRMKDRKDGKLK